MNTIDAVGPGVSDWLIDSLQAWGINTLTDVQARALGAGIADGRSMVVSAPTSSGKTLVGEIAVLTALAAGRRAIYLVSHKALADQKYSDFSLKFGELALDPIASVGLNTGDRAEGDIDAQLMVATYEKALGLIVTGQLRLTSALVVADELQIIGEAGRGPEIETLCSILRQGGLNQFVALTATVENPEDIAGWMGCSLVRSFHRDVPLHQEIWYSGRVHRTTFGDEEGAEIESESVPTGDIHSVVRHLLTAGGGPALVFVESRGEAAKYAAAFSQTRTRGSEGIALAEQLDLFSEPTEASEQLRANAERRVTFHTADLSSQERQVIEAGFSNSKFDVCFATSTLAAGVNFPFRSIVFPKLTFQFGDRAGSNLSRSDYRNMSGRAGRLGMHSEGFAVLLPRSRAELQHANMLVSPANDRLTSQFVHLSLRKSILMLVASRLASNLDEVMSFFRNTLYWYQTLDRNPAKLSDLERESVGAIQWLATNKMVRDMDGSLIVTPFGNATAASGLLPATAVQFSVMIRKIGPALEESFDLWSDGLIYAACASQEFYAKQPSRYLPYPRSSSYDSVTFWSPKNLPASLDRADLKLAQCAHAIVLYAEGLAERKIAHATKVPSGQVHRLATEVAWVLDGLHKLACVPEVGCSQNVSNQIAMLARRVNWGAPLEALDVMRIAERHRVPGFGRQRAMTLITQGITTLHDLVTTAKDKLIQLLRSDHRAQALLDAVLDSMGHGPDRLAFSHARIAKNLGLETVVGGCDSEIGIKYEQSVVELLRVESAWVVRVLDDGKRQNVPDILIEMADVKILLECKTCQKSPPLINKEEAWAVIQKSADFDRAMRRVTLGKPVFDETSKKKAAASHDITLVEHTAFIEGLLRVHAGTLQPREFLDWLAAPGIAEIERLAGIPTFAA